jgi:hypothetical protein
MRRFGLALLLLLVPLAAGCGSDPSSFQGSGDALKDASSSRVEWKTEGKSLPDWALMRATGSIDYANGRGELVIKGKSDEAPAAHALYLGHDAYMGAEVGGSSYWMKSSVDEGNDTDRFMPGPNGMSPDRLLNELIKSSTKVDKVGSEAIRGVDTTHYRAHLEQTKHETEPPVVDVWIDGQGLPRRIRATRGSGDDFAEVVDLFDFGVPVDVKAPPANEILSEEKFSKVMEKACAGAEQNPENMGPLCLLFGGTITSTTTSGDQTFSAQPVPTTEGK